MPEEPNNISLRRRGVAAAVIAAAALPGAPAIAASGSHRPAVAEASASRLHVRHRHDRYSVTLPAKAGQFDTIYSVRALVERDLITLELNTSVPRSVDKYADPPDFGFGIVVDWPDTLSDWTDDLEMKPGGNRRHATRSIFYGAGGDWHGKRCVEVRATALDADGDGVDPVFDFELHLHRGRDGTLSIEKAVDISPPHTPSTTQCLPTRIGELGL